MGAQTLYVRDMISLGIVGVTGRMGASLLTSLQEYTNLCLDAVLVRSPVTSLPSLPTHTRQETDPHAFMKDLDVVIDFSTPDLSLALLEAARTHKTPLVVCTTGHTNAFDARAMSAATTIPLMIAPNTSLGVAVLDILLARAAPLLETFDIALHEVHHVHKKDAPSGTAKSLLKTLQGALPPHKEIQVTCQRLGGVLGEHTVSFASEDEALTLSHTCINRALFAKGALHAAQWLAMQPPGRYTMHDMLLASHHF